MDQKPDCFEISTRLEHSYEVVGKREKKAFPQGDSAILRHILENFTTVEEVVAFFDRVWFENGFTSAQMHVADRFGHFAIVSPSGNRVLTDRKIQVSTNFRACGGTKEEAAVCWRFPLATEKLTHNGPSSATPWSTSPGALRRTMTAEEPCTPIF